MTVSWPTCAVCGERFPKIEKAATERGDKGSEVDAIDICPFCKDPAELKSTVCPYCEKYGAHVIVSDGAFSAHCDSCGRHTGEYSDIDELERFVFGSAPIDGRTSDGYHTFDELYTQRGALFSALCRAYPELSWVAPVHADDTMYDGMFIAGIETPAGQAAFHIERDLFKMFYGVKRLERAPEFDGNMFADALERIAFL